MIQSPREAFPRWPERGLRFRLRWECGRCHASDLPGLPPSFTAAEAPTAHHLHGRCCRGHHPADISPRCLPWPWRSARHRGLRAATEKRARRKAARWMPALRPAGSLGSMGPSRGAELTASCPTTNRGEADQFPICFRPRATSLYQAATGSTTGSTAMMNEPVVQRPPPPSPPSQPSTSPRSPKSCHGTRSPRCQRSLADRGPATASRGAKQKPATGNMGILYGRVPPSTPHHHPQKGENGPVLDTSHRRPVLSPSPSMEKLGLPGSGAATGGKEMRVTCIARMR